MNKRILIIRAAVIAVVLIGVMISKAKKGDFQTGMLAASSKSAKELYSQAVALRKDRQLMKAKNSYQKILSDYPNINNVEGIQKELEDLNLEIILSGADKTRDRRRALGFISNVEPPPLCNGGLAAFVDDGRRNFRFRHFLDQNIPWNIVAEAGKNIFRLHFPDPLKDQREFGAVARLSTRIIKIIQKVFTDHPFNRTAVRRFPAAVQDQMINVDQFFQKPRHTLGTVAVQGRR